MLIEDDALNAKILQKILEREGYSITWFESGERFFERFDELSFDLVLLDVVLPGIDGLEVCRQLKSAEASAEAPVIFITARKDADDIVAGFEAGGADYIPKPFQPRETLARVRTHLQLRELHARQAAIIADLDAAVKARNRLLGVTAHDLRNPMISIQGFAEMLRDEAVGAVNAEQKEMAAFIASAATSMLELIDDLLDLSSIEAGELKLCKKENDLGEVINMAVFLYRGHAEGKEMTIEMKAPPSPVRCVFDSVRMKQVAENILSNAIKFSPAGARIEVEWGCSEQGGYFSVRDEGPGIPEAERDRLFQDYGKTSVRPTAGEKSTGLGLAICRKIVEAHGGNLNVSNLPDNGCEFKVTVPR